MTSCADRFKWLESFALEWEDSFPECARKLVISIGNAGLAEAGPSICRILASARTGWVRDGAALAARRLKLAESVDILMRRIEDAERRGVGTLVYALQFLDCRRAIVLLARVLAERFDYEQVEMALQAIESIEGPLDAADAEKACTLLIEALKTRHEDYDKYLTRAVKIIKERGNLCPVES